VRNWPKDSDLYLDEPANDIWGSLDDANGCANSSQSPELLGSVVRLVAEEVVG